MPLCSNLSPDLQRWIDCAEGGGHGVHEVFHRVDARAPRHPVLFTPPVDADHGAQTARVDLTEGDTGGELVASTASSDMAGVMKNDAVRVLYSGPHRSTKKGGPRRSVVGKVIGEARLDRIHRCRRREDQIAVGQRLLPLILPAEEKIALRLFLHRIVEPRGPEKDHYD